jgi:hypothetical protein
MKKALFTVAIILSFSTISYAQTLTSVQVMPLTQSQQFLNRVEFQILLAAPSIETEIVAYTPAGGDTHPSSASCHSARALLAANVSKYPSGYPQVFALHIVTSGNITTAGALTGSGQTLDTPASDGALFSAVNAMWSDTAGCVTFP